jgi:hypothetical protein
VGLWLMVGFGFATGLMDGFRFYGFVVMGLSAWVYGGLGLWVWVCRHGFVVDRWCGGLGLWVWVCQHGFVVAWVCGYGFVVDRWWLCAVCGGFAGMVVVSGGSVQCVGVVVCGVGFQVWWLSVVALCSVWWVCGYGGCRWWLCAVCGCGGLRCGFSGTVVVGGGSVQCVVVCGVGLRVWWLWVCGGPTTMSWQLPLSAMIINNIPIFFNGKDEFQPD